MYKLSRVVVVSVAVLTGFTAFPLSAAADGHLMTFIATLSGGGESPGVATGAFGDAEFILDTRTLQIDYTVRVYNSPSVTAAHIHVGSAGTSGPVIYPLAPSAGSAGDHTFRGRLDLDTDLLPRAERGILSGTDVEQILRMFDGHNMYVNVHTSPNPSGEIRGQLRREN